MAARNRSISPILADLSQDIAGEIPIELVLSWNTHEKTAQAQKKFLKAYERTGTLVSSDSAGLSKLSRQRPLLEVIHLISQPKEVIFQYGKAAGGEPVGIWVADNTQMFYKENINSKTVVEAMIAAQHEITKLTVQVGIGLHRGTFWEIGGGMYGAEADWIEDVTENDLSGGQLVVSETIKEMLPQNLNEVLKKWAPKLFDVDHGRISTQVSKHSERAYPHQFSPEFFAMLLRFDQISEAQRREVADKFDQKTHVILLKIKHLPHKLLLDSLTDRVVSNAYVKKTAAEFELTSVKSNGELGIFLTHDTEVAIAFAQKVREVVKNEGLLCNVGITFGEVLLFPLTGGNLEISGEPVNIASKLAEDADTWGSIYIEASAVPKKLVGKPFRHAVSHIEIKGMEL
jgi:class 3 adenylate cyclase